jgi:hypothetical protein
MKIELIEEHHVAVDLIPAKANILDLGCRGFKFTNHWRFIHGGTHNVVAVDCDRLRGYEREYHQIAVSDYNGLCGIKKFDDPNATQIQYGNDVECYTLEKLMQYMDVEQWDLMKVDIEGSEHKVLRNMLLPRAKQISVEFHLHLPNNDESDIEKTVHHLLELGYEIATHELTQAHGAGWNYWSSLFILK